MEINRNGKYVFPLVGESGSGKSSFLNNMCSKKDNVETIAKVRSFSSSIKTCTKEYFRVYSKKEFGGLPENIILIDTKGIEPDFKNFKDLIAGKIEENSTKLKILQKNNQRIADMVIFVIDGTNLNDQEDQPKGNLKGVIQNSIEAMKEGYRVTFVITKIDLLLSSTIGYEAKETTDIEQAILKCNGKVFKKLKRKLCSYLEKGLADIGKKINFANLKISPIKNYDDTDDYPNLVIDRLCRDFVKKCIFGVIEDTYKPIQLIDIDSEFEAPQREEDINNTHDILRGEKPIPMQYEKKIFGGLTPLHEDIEDLKDASKFITERIKFACADINGNKHRIFICSSPNSKNSYMLGLFNQKTKVFFLGYSPDLNLYENFDIAVGGKYFPSYEFTIGDEDGSGSSDTCEKNIKYFNLSFCNSKFKVSLKRTNYSGLYAVIENNIQTKKKLNLITNQLKRAKKEIQILYKNQKGLEKKRTEDLKKQSKINKDLEKKLLDLFPKKSPHFPNSLILNENQKDQLYKLCNIGGKWKKLYTASIDGFASQIFHQKCDNKPGTLVIAESNCGNIFGGFNSSSWNVVTNQYRYENGCFLFKLTGKSVKLEQKKQGGHSIYCNIAYGPTFGGNPGPHDFHLSNHCNKNYLSCCNVGDTYNPSLLGINQNLNGSLNYQVKNYEVYQHEK